MHYWERIMVKTKTVALYVSLLTSFFCIGSLAAKEIKMIGADGFEIFGDYTASNVEGNKGVLMLHQCNQDKSMYLGLAKKLSKAGISSMSLDFRGYGKSVSGDMSIAKLREKATSREHYFEMANKVGLGKHRESDVEIAYQYLSNRLGSEAKISLIGASCGGTQAVLSAQKHKPESFIFFSVGMNKNTTKLFNKVSDSPALIIASQDDGNTFTTANKIFRSAKNKNTRLISYKGNGHGKPLFKQDPNLENKMVEWFKLDF